MSEFTEHEIQKVLLGPYIKGQVSHDKGSVTPYCDFNLPPFLQSPLHHVHNDKGTSHISGMIFYPAIQSGRSDIVYDSSRWFKLKGDDPTGRSFAECLESHISHVPDWMFECPEGSMTEECARHELEVNDVVVRKISEYGFNAPHIPAGLVKYDVGFKGGKTYAAILQTYGETRLSQNSPKSSDRDWQHIFKLLNEMKTGLGESFLQSIMGWIGFANKLFKEARICLDTESLGQQNITIYRIGNNYGIFPIDHEYSIIRSVSGRAISYDAWRLHWILKVTGVRNKEHYKDIFYKGFDGQIIPRPVDRRVVELALS